MVRLLGYTRVSTAGQDARLQLDALLGAGVQKRDVFADVTSGTRAGVERPGMAKLLAYAEPGDTVVVWRVDRLLRWPQGSRASRSSSTRGTTSARTPATRSP